MLVVVYVMLMCAALLACSGWAMLKRERGAQAVFAGGAGLLTLLLGACLGGGLLHDIEVLGLVVILQLGTSSVLLLCHALVCAFKDKT
jgi:hypothetical protein